MRRVSTFLLCAAVSAIVQITTAARASADPILGTAANFAVLGGSATTNTGPTTITGNYGVSTGTSLGLVGVTLTGASEAHATDSVAAQAQADLTTAYTGLQGLLATSDLSGQNLGGMTLTSGVYSFGTSATLTGTLTLDAQGLANAFFVFKTGTTLTTASGPGSAAVQIINGGANTAVYWVVGSAATIGTYTSFQGNILALNGIALQTGATIGCGRALNQIPGPVTMDTNTISADCGSLGLSNSSLAFDSAGNIVTTGTGTSAGTGGTGGTGDTGGTGGDTASVPEPGALMLVLSGIACLVARTRSVRARQRDQAAQA